MLTHEQLLASEKKVYSQQGEDGVTEAILKEIGPNNKTFIEIGVEDGRECNTRFLRDKLGWTGVMIDKNPNPGIVQLWVTKDVQRQLKEKGVPPQPDVFSLDIDGNDFWVFKNLGDYLPTRLLIVEANMAWGPIKECRVMPYDEKHVWDIHTAYYGANQSAMHRLASELGYCLVFVNGGCDPGRNKFGNPGGCNMFFVPSSFKHHFPDADNAEKLYLKTAWPPGAVSDIMRQKFYDPWVKAS